MTAESVVAVREPGVLASARTGGGAVDLELSSRTVAIIQPHYLPWLGYFDMIDQVDTFVFLDTVQFVRRSWQHRNRIKTPQGWCWLSLPVSAREGSRPTLHDARIVQGVGWAEQHGRSVSLAYGRAPHWEQWGPWWEALMDRVAGGFGLTDVTCTLVTEIARRVGIGTTFVRASDLSVGRTGKDDYLASLCARLGAERYLSPYGSLDYLRDSQAFEQQGIELLFHRYEHPIYPQRFGDFLSHLSIVDVLFNAGPKALDIVRAGRRPSFSREEIAACGVGLADPASARGML